MDERAKERFNSIVGKPLRDFLLEKYQTQKRASKFLDLSEENLSKLLSGERPPSRALTLRIIKLGFDKVHFDLYEDLMEMNPEDLTKKELLDLLLSYKFLIKSQQSLIRTLTKEYKNI